MIADDLKDKKGFWTSVYVNSVVLGYNTNLTKGQAMPRSYNDLLLPRWKGRKISVDDTYATFLQGLISVWGKDKALDYLKKLAEQEPVVMRGSTVRVQLAAAGEFPLVIAYANIIQYLAEKGAPVDWLPLEPAVISVNTVMAGSQGEPSERGEAVYRFYTFKRRPGETLGFPTHPIAQRCRAETGATVSRLQALRRASRGNAEISTKMAKLYSQILKTR